MKNHKWYSSISILVPLIMALTLLVPVTVFFYYSNSTNRNHYLESAKNTIYTNLYGSSLLVEKQMEDVSEFAKELCEDDQLCAYLEKFAREQEHRSATRSHISLILSQSIGKLRYLEAIYLIGEEQQVIISTNLREKEASIATGWGEKLYSFYADHAVDQINWYSLPFELPNQNGRMCYFRPMEVSSIHGGFSAVFVVNESYMQNLIQLPYTDSVVYVCDYEGRSILCAGETENVSAPLSSHDAYAAAFSTSDDYGVYERMMDGKTNIIMFYNSVGSGWKYFTIVPKEQIFSSYPGQGKSPLLIALSGVLSVLVGYGLLRRKMIRPMQQLNAHMKQVEAGKLNPLHAEASSSEIQSLLRGYNHMIVELKRTIDENYVQQLLTKQAELKSLHAQIDEHFLYNTLNSIYCEASREGADVSADMLLVLSKYFRLSLSHGQDKIGLAEVAEMINCYLQIQQMRYGDRLRCIMEGFPDMERYCTLKYLYQPIVENAIVHGFEKNAGKHTLHIRFSKDEDRLFFSVSDDGAGMSPKRIKQVMEESQPFDKGGGGFALKNIREQLRITYGEGYDIVINSTVGKGTTVSFYTPLERKNDHEN